MRGRYSPGAASSNWSMCRLLIVVVMLSCLASVAFVTFHHGGNAFRNTVAAFRLPMLPIVAMMQKKERWPMMTTTTTTTSIGRTLQDTNLDFADVQQHGIARSAMEMELNDSNDDQDHFNDSLFHNSSIPAWRLIVTSLLCWIVTSCAVAAGIGGGGLLVPLYALILLGGNSSGNDNSSSSSSSTKLAIPISACTILGVAVGNVAFLVTKRHPHANRPLVDYATVVLMQPGELMGVVVGVLFHTWFPDVLIVILLVLVLGFTAYKTIEKGYARWQAETHAMLFSSPVLQPLALEHEEHLGLVSEDCDDCVDADIGDGHKFQTAANPDSPDVEYSTVESTDEEREEPYPDECSLGWSAELARIEEYEARQFPHSIYAALFLMTTFLTLYSLLLNNVIVHGLDNCSPSVYWPAYWSPVLVFGMILWYFAGYNTRRYAKKVELGFQFVEGDVHWNISTIRLLVPAAVGAGTLAGMLGIGGGMVLGPLFVALNFEVSVAKRSPATSCQVANRTWRRSLGFACLSTMLTPASSWDGLHWIHDLVYGLFIQCSLPDGR